MCGATGAQTALQEEQMQFYQQAQEMTAEQYANQEAIYGPMAKQFESIFEMGPNQKGFSDEETNDLNASAVEGTAENYSQAAKAVSENLAAEGGGNSAVSVGGQAQIKSEVANSAAAEESKQVTEIKQADYNQGYNEWLASAQGLDTIAAGENPLGYEGAATNAGSAASTTANDIAQEDNSWINAALGAAGAIGGGALGGKGW
jgi:hypothetical protein